MASDVIDQVRYCIWRLELWGRDYGSYDTIDRDVSEGVLIPGTMPAGYERPVDKWISQAEAERRGVRR